MAGFARAVPPAPPQFYLCPRVISRSRALGSPPRAQRPKNGGPPLEERSQWPRSGHCAAITKVGPWHFGGAGRMGGSVCPMARQRVGLRGGTFFRDTHLLSLNMARCPIAIFLASQQNDILSQTLGAKKAAIGFFYSRWGEVSRPRVAVLLTSQNLAKRRSRQQH